MRNGTSRGSKEGEVKGARVEQRTIIRGKEQSANQHNKTAIAAIYNNDTFGATVLPIHIMDQIISILNLFFPMQQQGPPHETEPKPTYHELVIYASNLQGPYQCTPKHAFAALLL